MRNSTLVRTVGLFTLSAAIAFVAVQLIDPEVSNSEGDHGHDHHDEVVAHIDLAEVDGQIHIRPEVAKAMADGKITEGEYADAADAVLRCANGERSVLTLEQSSATGLWNGQVSSGATSEDLARAETCYREHGQLIDATYQTQDDVQEERAKQFEPAYECAQKTTASLRRYAEAAWNTRPWAESSPFELEEFSDEELVTLAVEGASELEEPDVMSKLIKCSERRLAAD